MKLAIRVLIVLTICFIAAASSQMFAQGIEVTNPNSATHDQVDGSRNPPDSKPAVNRLTNSTITSSRVSKEQRTIETVSDNRLGAQNVLRSWTNTVSITMRYLVSNQVYPLLRVGASVVYELIPSPDGRYFFFTTSFGDLRCDCNAMELLVFAVADFGDLSSPPKPLRRIRMESEWEVPYVHPAISQAVWENEKSILFVGIDGGKSPKSLYRLDVSSGSLRQLTKGTHSIHRWHYGAAGESVVFAEEVYRPSSVLDQYPIRWGLGSNFQEAVSGDEVRYFSLYSQYKGSTQRLLGTYANDASDCGPWMAPDGKHAFHIYAPENLPVPEDWRKYDGIAEMDQFGAKNELAHLRLRRYMLVDIERGQSKPVLNSPAGTATRLGMHWDPTTNRVTRVAANVLWSKDSKHAVLVNEALPLDDFREERSRMAYIVDIDISTGKWKILEPLETALIGNELTNKKVQFVSTVTWLKYGDEFLVEHKLEDGSESTGTVYSFGANGWQGRSVPASMKSPPKLADPSIKEVKLADSLTASVRESQNEPFSIIVSNGQRNVTISEKDPALSSVWRAEIEPIDWKESNGHVNHGGLMLPRNSSTKNPIPLVIQLDIQHPTQFLPDGSVMSTYAAQSLVSSGFAVLLLQPASDRKAFLSQIDSAVESLTNRGIIDANLVGLVGADGFASSAYYALTHPHMTKIRAALINQWSSGVGTFDEYLFQGIILRFRRPLTEQTYGGTFWQKKTEWLENDPVFSADRVESPLLISCRETKVCRSMLPIVGALTLNRRPFDFLMFPDGDDAMLKPRPRLASLDATVDWMNFWLQGKEDPNPAKAGQYQRWRKMKADWEQVQKEEAEKKSSATNP